MKGMTCSAKGAAALPPSAARETLDAVRSVLENLALRVDQVRSVLEAGTRALDDRTLAQMLDTALAWEAIGPGWGEEAQRNASPADDHLATPAAHGMPRS